MQHLRTAMVKPVYALAYARVSDPRQAAKGISIPEQLSAVKRYAEREGIVILAEFVDAGESAYREDVKRPQFESMISQAKSDPRVSLILVHEASRFCRRKVKAVITKADLATHGVKVLSVLNPYDPNTIQGKWMEAIDETRAETESMATSMHVLEKMKGNIGMRDRETGWCFKNGGRAPAGYRNLPVQRGVDYRGRPVMRLLWELDPVWGERLQFIVRELKLKQNLSYEKIRDYCNGQGWQSPELRPVSTSFIREIFREDRLLQAAGYAFWNREDRKTKGRRFKPRDQWVMIPNAHPALITEEEVRQCRELISQHSFNNKNIPQEDSRFLLTGRNGEGERFFVCTCCGANVIGHDQGGRHKPKYTCASLVYRATGCVPGVSYEKEELENYIFAQIEKRFGSQANIKRLIEKLNKELAEDNKAYVKALAGIDHQMKKTQKEIDNLVGELGKGIPEALKKRIYERAQELQTKKEDLERQKEQLLLMKPKVQKVDEKKLLAEFARFRNIRSNGTNRAKRRFIRRFVRFIEWRPEKEKVRIHWYMDPLDDDFKPTQSKLCAVSGTSPPSDTIIGTNSQGRKQPGFFLLGAWVFWKKETAFPAVCPHSTQQLSIYDLAKPYQLWITVRFSYLSLSAGFAIIAFTCPRYRPFADRSLGKSAAAIVDVRHKVSYKVKPDP